MTAYLSAGVSFARRQPDLAAAAVELSSAQVTVFGWSVSAGMLDVVMALLLVAVFETGVPAVVAIDPAAVAVAAAVIEAQTVLEAQTVIV